MLLYCGFRGFMRHRLIGRMLGVIVLLCAVASAQAVSLAEVHAHQHSSTHCCGLCHAGPLAFVPIAFDAAALPALAVLGLASAEDSAGARDLLSAAASSRAPPAYSRFAL